MRLMTLQGFPRQVNKGENLNFSIGNGITIGETTGGMEKLERN